MVEEKREDDQRVEIEIQDTDPTNSLIIIDNPNV